MSKLGRGELQRLVMDVLWEAGGYLTPREVQDVLSETHEVAYTTAMTVLTRLWEQGMVRRRAQGRGYAYVAAQPREEWIASRMEELLEASHDRAGALTHFVSAMDEGQRDVLRRALRKRGRRS